jgi:hypothetical protein
MCEECIVWFVVLSGALCVMRVNGRENDTHKHQKNVHIILQSAAAAAACQLFGSFLLRSLRKRVWAIRSKCTHLFLPCTTPQSDCQLPLRHLVLAVRIAVF